MQHSIINDITKQLISYRSGRSEDSIIDIKYQGFIIAAYLLLFMRYSCSAKDF